MYSSQSDAGFNTSSDRPIRVYGISSENRISRVYGKCGENGFHQDEHRRASSPPKDKLQTSKETTHGESVSVDAHALKGVASEAFHEPDTERLAKQQEQSKYNLTFNGDEFGYRAVGNVPRLCSKFNWLKFRDTTAEFYPCYRLTCANPFCRKKRAEREHNILAQSFLTQPPTYFCVLSFTDTPKYHDCSRWLKSLHMRNKYRDETYEYYTQVELSEQSLFHVHYLPRTKLTADELRQSIKQSVSAEHVVYVQPCHNPKATARYITKDKPGHAGVNFPLAWKGKGKRLTNCSKNFLSASRAELTKQAIQSFAAKKPHKGEVKDTSSESKASDGS